MRRSQGLAGRRPNVLKSSEAGTSSHSTTPFPTEIGICVPREYLLTVGIKR
jgi:hypothetical protein